MKFTKKKAKKRLSKEDKQLKAINSYLLDKKIGINYTTPETYMK